MTDIKSEEELVERIYSYKLTKREFEIVKCCQEIYRYLLNDLKEELREIIKNG